MNHYNWAEDFHRVYDRAVAAYRSGRRAVSSLLDCGDETFLSGIGCSAQEIFDFVEDGCECGEPAFDTVLLITSVRRDYFLQILKGARSNRPISMSDLPPKGAAVDGIRWLPRLIAKARAKLRGEMPPDLMYGCGGDRAFLAESNIHPADFLRETWAAGEDDRRIIEWVKKVRSPT